MLRVAWWVGGRSPLFKVSVYILQAWETFQWFCRHNFLPGKSGLHFARMIFSSSTFCDTKPCLTETTYAHFVPIRSPAVMCPNADVYVYGLLLQACNYAVLVARCIIVGPRRMTTSLVVVDNLIFHQWSFSGPQEICLDNWMSLSLHAKSLPRKT
jgi:hypothetical protein